MVILLGAARRPARLDAAGVTGAVSVLACAEFKPSGGVSVADNRAVVVDPVAPGRLVIQPVPAPVPDRGGAIVRVRRISLNGGEVRRSTMADKGWRPGWDLAGHVEKAAADGSGPKVGARVVGLLPEGAWAERVVVPTHALAELPEKVTFSQA